MSQMAFTPFCLQPHNKQRAEWAPLERMPTRRVSPRACSFWRSQLELFSGRGQDAAPCCLILKQLLQASPSLEPALPGAQERRSHSLCFCCRTLPPEPVAAAAAAAAFLACFSSSAFLSLQRASRGQPSKDPQAPALSLPLPGASEPAQGGTKGGEGAHRPGPSWWGLPGLPRSRSGAAPPLRICRLEPLGSCSRLHPPQPSNSPVPRHSVPTRPSASPGVAL